MCAAAHTHDDFVHVTGYNTDSEGRSSMQIYDNIMLIAHTSTLTTEKLTGLDTHVLSLELIFMSIRQPLDTMNE